MAAAKIDLKAQLDLAKERVRIPATWRALGLPGEPHPNPCRSPFREDRRASFSIFDDGRCWRDHASGEGGDIVDFVALALRCPVAEAITWVKASAGIENALPARVVPAPAAPKSPPVVEERRRPTVAKLSPMGADDLAVWQEGIAHLQNEPGLQAKIDSWRAWPAGTTCTLAEDGFMGSPVIRGARTVAFVVQDEAGREIGFHARHKPAEGERASWTFHPRGTPALPFVIGGGFARHARHVVVHEGQWDAVCFAASTGWLNHDNSWPEHCVVFGIRGVGGIRPLLERWLPLIPKTATFTLFPDCDDAGQAWTRPGGLRDRLSERGYVVRVVRSGEKDFTDLMRAQPLNRAVVEEVLSRRAHE